MLRKIRLFVALISLILLTLLFLDYTGTIHQWFGWMAKIQFVPAVLALNVSVIIFLLLLTLLLGRIYCSVICPLGLFQDLVSRISAKRKGKKSRFTYSKPMNWLRYTIFVVFVASMIAGINSIVSFIEPYSVFGRIISNIFAPLYRYGNNLLAYVSERMDNYAFYEVSVWIKSMPVLIVSLVSFVIIAILAWKNGRTYCNTFCPVGTLLGLVSRYSLFRPVIDKDKCNSCSLCSRKCKSSCIDSKNHTIDYSRCVSCMNCIDACRQGAVKWRYAYSSSDKVSEENVDTDRRRFLTVGTAAIISAAAKAEEKKVDGGLAVIEDKVIPERATPICPPGALNARNFTKHCTACQLCVSVCPNDVLRPSNKIETFMQPVMSYEKGYCRPECTKCSEVCPAGAIRPITVEDKSSVQIGHAVWVKKNCVPLTDGVSCGNCARHCPTGAIIMVPSDANDSKSLKIPVINEEKCIGCGACENLCPARPFTAIYVEGHATHRVI